MKKLIFVFLLVSSLKVAQAEPSKEKILDIIMTSSGLISSGNENIAEDKLAAYIKDRLFKSWLSPGKMYNKVRLTRNEQVSDIAFESVVKEIKEGQRQALVALCVEKYNKRFEELEPKKQEDLKKKYPALFTIEYS